VWLPSVWSAKKNTLVTNFSLMTKRLKQKWLRQQSKDFYVASIDALVKRWDERINVCTRYIEKYILFSGSTISCFMFFILLWPIYWFSNFRVPWQSATGFLSLDNKTCDYIWSLSGIHASSTKVGGYFSTYGSQHRPSSQPLRPVSHPLGTFRTTQSRCEREKAEEAE
jgi:hypothetical protein